MGLSGGSYHNNDNNNQINSSYYSEKLLVYGSYILLGAASSCIFLTLSLRLIPSLCGFSLILLHVLTIAAAVTGCAAASSSSFSSGAAAKWYGVHMVATVITAIFQGSVSVLVFTDTHNFLGSLKSYVREDDGAIILRMAGGLSLLIFCLDWVVLTLAFFSKFYGYNNNNKPPPATKKQQQQQQAQDEEIKNWPWPFQV